MLKASQLSSTSIQLLQRRSLSSQEISGFNDILERAKNSEISAKEFLKSISVEEMGVLKKANAYAGDINISVLSLEGAKNLLAQPDGSNRIDSNNDGIIEVGESKTIQFPPVNAPTYVQNAWKNATKYMSERDKLFIQVHLHTAIYGENIVGVEKKEPLSPEQQWNVDGLKQFFNKLYDQLKVRENLEGSSRYNLMLRDFYNRFEKELTGGEKWLRSDIRSKNEQGARKGQELVKQVMFEAKNELLLIKPETNLEDN